GHPAGDFVLKQTANLIREGLRAQDIFARYGGEEFALLLPESTSENAITLAEKLRSRIQTSVYEYNGKRIPVTISIGMATLKTAHTSPDDLVGEADQRL